MTSQKRWSYTSWEDSAKTSFNFDSFKVYVIEVFSEYESFIKIR